MPKKLPQSEVLSLPKQGLIRERTLLPFVGFSSSTLWRKVNKCEFPKPVKYGRITAWLAEEVHEWLEQLKAQR